MNLRTLLVLVGIASLSIARAQYGTFSAAAAKAAKTAQLVVVLDDGDSPYNEHVMRGVKGEWRLNSAIDYVTVSDLGMQPLSADKVYLLKTRRTDPVKFEGTFLAVVKGWKQKKGEALQQTSNCFTSIPAEQELASLLIDPRTIADGKAALMVKLYVQHLQDYLMQVEAGKITDKATADRLYSSRTRLVREGTLALAREHTAAVIPDGAAVKALYPSAFELEPLATVLAAVEAQDRTKSVSDVVLTVGDHRNKHCFKRVFNAGTGELMYLADDAALFGKKEGFIEEDLKNITRAR